MATGFYRALDLIQSAAFIHLVNFEEVIHIRRTLDRIGTSYEYPYTVDGAYGLLNSLEKNLNTINFDNIDMNIYSRNCITELRRSMNALSNEETRYLLDLSSVENTIDNIRQFMRDQLNHYNVKPVDADIYIVDDLPGPWAGRASQALTVDFQDFQLHGIKPGVYMKRDGLQPIFSQTVLLHEFVHVLMSAKDPFIHCRSIEEGFCELLGTLAWGGKVVGSSAADNAFIYSRLRRKQPDTWTYYLEMTRQCLPLYRAGGQQGLMNIVSSGRAKLKEIEEALWNGNPLQIGTHLTMTSDDLEISKRLDYLLLVFSRQMSVSPGAFVVAQHLSMGIESQQIAAEIGLPEAFVEEKLKELTGHPRLVHIHEGGHKVASCEHSRSIRMPEIRMMEP